MTETSCFRREYIARFNRVLDHIDRHLADELRLEALAGVALFSPFHFHRLFLAWQGETLADYIRRRRLEVAGMRLVMQPDKPVLTIALDCGFGSGESFARAFRQQFGCSPTAWRSKGYAAQRKSRHGNSKFGQVDGKIGQAGATGAGDDDGMTAATGLQRFQENIMSFDPRAITIETLAPVRIAYLRRTGPYGGPGIWEHWQRFNQWCGAHGMHGGRPMYGISLDDPTITAPEQCRYDAAVAVDADFSASGEAAIRELPGGRYALFEFFGLPEECGDMWMTLFREWLPDSGFQLDDRPCFEIYLPRHGFEPETKRFGCQIAIPVRAL